MPAQAVPGLIAAARAGDRDAFAQLYQGHLGAVQRYARRLASHDQAADDLVAESFTRTWEQLRAGRGPETAFMGYMRATVLHLHLRQLKDDPRYFWVADIETAAMANPDLAATIVADSPEHLVLEQLLNDQMKRALAALPRRSSQILVMVYIENHPYSRVAEQLGVSVDAARQLALRARARMRTTLAALAAENQASASTLHAPQGRGTHA